MLASGAGDGHGRWRATAVRDFALSAGRFRGSTRGSPPTPRASSALAPCAPGKHSEAGRRSQKLIGAPSRPLACCGTSKRWYRAVTPSNRASGASVADCVLRVYAARQAYRIARPADVVAAATVVPDAAEIFAGFGIRSR